MRRYVTIGGIVVATLFAGSMAAIAQPVPAPEPVDCAPAAQPSPGLVPEPGLPERPAPPEPRVAPPAPQVPEPPAGPDDPADPADPPDAAGDADFGPMPGTPERTPRTVPAPGSGRAPVSAPEAARTAAEQDDPAPAQDDPAPAQEDPTPAQEDPEQPAQDDPAPAQEDPTPAQEDPEQPAQEDPEQPAQEDPEQPAQDDPAPAQDDPAVPGDDCTVADEPTQSVGHETSAAAMLDWGEPNRIEEFDGPLGESWNVYDGPGHAGNGRRTPEAVSISDGILTITGDSAGATAGMAWNPGQKYGRWEGRVQAPASDESYNALLLLWPDAEDFPVGGEIDFMEMMDHTRQTTNIFLHYGANNDQVVGEVDIDATEWHNWAVEWTPTHVAAFVDGEEWWRTTDVDILPPRAMHLCIQLDWFPKGGDVQESYMYVDWVKQYSLDAGDVISGAGDDLIGTADGVGEAAGELTEGVTDAGTGIVDEVTGPLTEGAPDPAPGRRGLVDRAVPTSG